MFRGDARVARAVKSEKRNGQSGLRQGPTFTFNLLPFALVMLTLALASGCRQKMANQPRYDSLESSNFFQDGMSARPRIPGTVARGELAVNPLLETGKMNGALVDGYPFPITMDVVNRGEQR